MYSRKFALTAITVGFSVLVFLVGGCMFGNTVKELDPGMTKAEVIKKLGKPDGYKKQGKREILSYYNKVVDGTAMREARADYHFIFEDGFLVEWGAGEIRQHQGTGMVFLYKMG